MRDTAKHVRDTAKHVRDTVKHVRIFGAIAISSSVVM